MKNTICLGLIFFLFSCNSNPEEKKTRQLLVFESQIDSGKEIDRRLVEKKIYNSQEQVLSEIWYDGSGSVDYKIDYSYDSKGRKIKDVYTLNNKCNSISKFQYRDNDSISIIEVYKPNNKLDFTFRCYYNQSGFNDKDLCENADKSIRLWDVYKWSKSGRLDKWIRYNPDSTVQSKVVYEYDHQNREIKKTCSGALGGTYSFKYNKKGLKSEEMAYNTEDKTFLWLKVFSYDASNRITRVLEYNDPKHRPDNPYKISHYEYKFW